MGGGTVITSDDLTGVDPTVARRLLVVARAVAPCIPNLEGDAKLDAIAILQSVATELPGPGMTRARSQSRNGTSVSWADYSSAFSADDRSALRALCSASLGVTGAPVGSFPPAVITRDIWPPEPTQ